MKYQRWESLIEEDEMLTIDPANFAKFDDEAGMSRHPSTYQMDGDDSDEGDEHLGPVNRRTISSRSTTMILPGI
jgi:hypothetical protein